MADSIKDIQDKIQKTLQLNKLNSQTTKDYQKQADAIATGGNELSQWRLLLENIDNSIDKISDNLDYVTQSFKDSVQDLQKANIAIGMQKSALTKLTSIARNLSDIRRGETATSEKDLKKIKEQIRQRRSDLELAMKLAIKEEGQDSAKVGAMSQQLKDIELIEEGWKKVAEVNRKINNELGFTPSILGGIDKSLQKLGLPSLGIADAIGETQKLGQRADALGESFSPLLTFGKQLGKNFLEAYSLTKLLEVGFAALVATAVKLDKLTADMADNLGISYYESLDLQKSFNEISKNTNNAFITTKSLGESYSALNKNLSNSTNFSDDLVKDFTELSKQADISNEALATLSKITVATGTDLKKNTAEFQGQVALLNAQNKTSMSEKQVLEEISKISSATTLSLGMQPKALAKAVYQAKALGLEMAQIESIASSLLDFESSIQNELEAELLTGKNLNLEKARLAALNGDIATVAEEIAKQTGSAADFTKMNVIQQEALAKSVGMTRDDLAKSLMEREALAKLGGKEGTALEQYNKLLKEGLSQDEIAKKLGDEKLAQQLHSESVQARFNAAIEKAQELFVDLSTTFLPIVSGLADGAMHIGNMVAKAAPLVKIFGAIYGTIQGISLLTKGMVATTKVLTAYEEGRIALKLNFLELLGIQQTKDTFIATLEKEKSILAATQAALQKTILGSLIAQGAAMIKNLATGAKDLAVAVATAGAKLVGVSATTFGLGLVGVLAAAAAGIGFLSSISKPAGDVISEAKGKTRISTKEGELLELSDNDDLVAAPGAAKALENNKSSSPQINISAMGDRIVEAINTQNQLLERY